jgi:hypothetical protein
MDADTIANMGSTVAAIVAIFIGIWQFRKQQNDSGKIARANIKPLLKIVNHNFDGEKKIMLNNLGLGSAIITRIFFCKDGIPNAHRVSDLLNLDHKPRIDNVWKFIEPTYNRAGEGITEGFDLA